MAGAAVAVAAFGVASVKAAADAQRVMAQTEAVLKSTSGAANVTADEVVNLAQRLRDLTGVDDEAIQASSNLLLTFRDVRNEVGAGNDIFNQAQVAIVDMATALNEGAVPATEDLHSATLQLGKALNDPIQGMTALRRVGVSFSSQQTEVIKRLAESGNLLKAQKLILAELTKEFGGAGEAAGKTFAGQLSILRSQIEDVFEAVGQSLLPILQNLVGVLQRTLVPALTFLGDHLGEVSVLLGTYAAFKFVPLLLDAIGAAAGRAAVLLANLEVSAIGAATALGTLAKLVPLAGLGLGGYREDVSETVDVTHGFAHALDDEKQKAALVEAGINNLSGAVGKMPSDYNPATSSIHDMNEELKRQLDLTLSIADPTFALIQAVRDNKTAENELAAAHRHLNQLERDGKEGTKAYAEARKDLADKALAAATSEAAVAGAARALDAAIKEGKASRKDINDDLEAIGKAAGLSGKDIQQLKNDVRSGLSTAAALARQLAPEVGRALSSGIANGITTSSELITVASANAVHEAIRAARQAAGAESPSKEMFKLGVDMAEGLVQGFLKSQGKIVDAAKSTLDKVLSAASSFRGTIRGAFEGFFDIGAFSEPGASPGEIGAIAGGQAAQAQQFAAVLNALQRQGASKGLLAEIAGAGAEGIPFAQSLLQGGPALIKDVNQSLATIADAAGDVSERLTKSYFGDRIDSLKDQLSQENDKLREANEILRRIERAVENDQKDIVLQIDGETLARITRNQINKLADRNAGSGLR